MGLRIETGTFRPEEGTRTKTRLMLDDPGYDIRAVEVHPVKSMPGKEPGDPERRYLIVTVVGATREHVAEIISSGKCQVQETTVMRTRLTRDRQVVEEWFQALDVAIRLEPDDYHVVSSEPQSHIRNLISQKLEEQAKPQ